MRIGGKAIKQLGSVLCVYGKALHCRAALLKVVQTFPGTIVYTGSRAAACGCAQTQNQTLRDRVCIFCLHLFKRIVQISLYCVDDGDYDVVLKSLGLEKV